MGNKGNGAYRVERENLHKIFQDTQGTFVGFSPNMLARAIIRGLNLFDDKSDNIIALNDWNFSIQNGEKLKPDGLLDALKISGDTYPVLVVRKKRRRLVEKRPIHRLFNQILDANNL